MTIKTLVKYSLIAAIYVVLSLVLGSLSFASIQIRVSELLMIMCIFDKKYIMPLTLGCFLTNLIGLLMGVNALPLDLIFGTLATYVSGLLMFKFRNILFFNRPLISLIMPGIVNGIIVGLELAIYLYSDNSFLALFGVNALWVFVGELISVYILGLILFEPINKLVTYLDTYK